MNKLINSNFNENKSPISGQSYLNNKLMNPEPKIKKSIIWKTEEDLTEKKYFLKNDRPTNQLSERKLYEQRENVIKKIKKIENLKWNSSNNDIKNENTIEKLKWERPIVLQRNLIKDNFETKESKLNKKRLENKIPCYYMREYNIPNHPKKNLLNLKEGKGAVKLNFKLENNPKEKRSENLNAKSLKDLFVPGTKSIFKRKKRELNLVGILKQGNITNSEYVIKDPKEIEILKNLILIMGLNINDINSFFHKLNQNLQNPPNFLNYNIKIAEDFIEKFHKFRLQNYNNKCLALLPKKTLIQTNYTPPPSYAQQNHRQQHQIYHQQLQHHQHHQQHQQYQHQQAHLLRRPINPLLPPNRMLQPTQRLPPAPRMFANPLLNQNQMMNNQRLLMKNQMIGTQNPLMQNQNMKMNMMNYNIQKKNNNKRKTVPCVWYHSTNGCQRGDNCDFIHDPNFKGLPTPNMAKYVRPIHQLSKNPEMNKKNLQRYGRFHTKGFVPSHPNPNISNNILNYGNQFMDPNKKFKRN